MNIYDRKSSQKYFSKIAKVLRFLVYTTQKTETNDTYVNNTYAKQTQQ